MDGTLIFIIVHIVIIITYMLLIILNILNFKNIEKEIKARKDYIYHVRELVDEHSSYINTLIFIGIALVYLIFFFFSQIIKYNT